MEITQKYSILEHDRLIPHPFHFVYVEDVESELVTRSLTL